MLAGCGINDIFLAYTLVGPNCTRMAKLAQTFPKCQFLVQADHPAATKALSEAMQPASLIRLAIKYTPVLVEGIVSVLVVLVVGIYLAADPRHYERGVLHLEPNEIEAEIGGLGRDLDVIDTDDNADDRFATLELVLYRIGAARMGQAGSFCSHLANA